MSIFTSVKHTDDMQAQIGDICTHLPATNTVTEVLIMVQFKCCIMGDVLRKLF